MRRQAPDACVVGGFELVRALGSAGVRSLVLGDDVSARLSRYAVPAPKAGDGPIADVLVSALGDAGGPMPLFTDRDDTIVAVSAARERLAEHFLFLLPSREIVDAVTDKARFQELAAELDLPVPPGKRIDPCHDDPSELGLGHPLVVKPLPFRNDAWRETFGAGAKALRVDRQDDLVALWPLLAGTGLEFIAQELVPGDETHIVSYHVYVDSDGAVAGEFTGRKIRTHPAEFGMSSALVTTDDEPLVRVGRDIVERLGLRGPAKLDFKRPPGGGLYLLEVNARFTLWCHPGAVAGVNLPAIAYADLTGQPRPASRRARGGVRWINPREDLAAARERGIPLRRWLPWALRCQSNPAFAWRDPGPALKHLLGR
jgi:predicted ATP-grasp superfamily ATP-dependent carboligase